MLAGAGDRSRPRRPWPRATAFLRSAAAAATAAERAGTTPAARGGAWRVLRAGTFIVCSTRDFCCESLILTERPRLPHRRQHRSASVFPRRHIEGSQAAVGARRVGRSKSIHVRSASRGGGRRQRRRRHPCVHYHPKAGAKAGLEGDHEGDHEPIDRLDHTTPTREDRPTATKATRSEHRG